MRILLFVALLITSWSGAEAQKRIALSFDDVPRGRGAFFTPDERTKPCRIWNLRALLNLPDGRGRRFPRR